MASWRYCNSPSMTNNSCVSKDSSCPKDLPKGKPGNQQVHNPTPKSLRNSLQIHPPASPSPRATSPLGVLSSQGDAGSAYGFAGEWHDPSGMLHLRARYYEPALGRFFQPVPWGGSAFDRLTQIPFVDALNDPIQIPFPHAVQ